MKTTRYLSLIALAGALSLAGCARNRCCPSPCGSPCGSAAWQPVEAVPTGPTSTVETLPTGDVSAGTHEALTAEQAAARLHGHRFQSLACTSEKCLSVVEALARTAGVNIVVSAEARERMGPVTLDFKDVSLAEALDHLTKAHGLTWTDNGDGSVSIDVAEGAEEMPAADEGSEAPADADAPAADDAPPAGE
ncbi:MAG: STN domain-containing protein [Planctomycetota bacterium]